MSVPFLPTWWCSFTEALSAQMQLSKKVKIFPDDVMLHSSNKGATSCGLSTEPVCSVRHEEFPWRERGEEEQHHYRRRTSNERGASILCNCTMLLQTTIGGHSRDMPRLPWLSHLPQCQNRLLLPLPHLPHRQSASVWHSHGRTWLYLLFNKYVCVQETLL